MKLAGTDASVDIAREWAGKFLFIAAAAIFLWVGLSNIDQPLLENHAFRQTQTALTAFWLRANGFSLDYETPVLGAPWSIPFEFPLYQVLVAWLSTLTGAGLDPVGRVVSLLCGLAACLPLYRSLRLLGVPPGAAHFANALYLTAPLYLFWSSTFMIESLALLLAVSAGYWMVRIYRYGATVRDLALLFIFLAGALLQKVTTGALPAVAGLALFAWRALQSTRGGPEHRGAHVRDALWVLAAAALAFGAGYAWIAYSDGIRARNEFGAMLTSKALNTWNFGTLEQRFSKAFLVSVVYERILSPSTAWGLGLLAVVALFLRAGESAAKRVAALALVLFAAPLAVFTNLHYVHDYYQVANVVFLSCAVAVAVYAACGLVTARFVAVAPLVMVAAMAANLRVFQEGYWYTKSSRISEQNNLTLRIAHFLRVHTRAEQPILILGYDWSSELAYYAERKSLTVPMWARPGTEVEAIRSPGRFLPSSPSAIVSCPAKGMDEARAAMAAAYPQGQTIPMNPRCEVLLTHGISGQPPQGREGEYLLLLQSAQVLGDKFGTVALDGDDLNLHPGATTPTSVSFDLGARLKTMTIKPFIAQLDPYCEGQPQAGVVGFETLVDGRSLGRAIVDRRSNTERTLDLRGVRKLEFRVDIGNGTSMCDWFRVRVQSLG